MEAIIFTQAGSIIICFKKVKVAYPLMVRAIAAAKKKNDRIDASKIADCLRCDFLPNATWPRPKSTGRCAGDAVEGTFTE